MSYNYNITIRRKIMKKIILTTLLACTTTVMADHETISSDLTKKFVETKPTVLTFRYANLDFDQELGITTEELFENNGFDEE